MTSLIRRSPRERDPETARRVVRAAALLERSGRPLEAAWLQLALVDPELRRGGLLAEDALPHARAAAVGLGQAGWLRAAVEVWLAAGEIRRVVGMLGARGLGAFARRLEQDGRRRTLGTWIPGIGMLSDDRSVADPEQLKAAVLEALAYLEAVEDPGEVVALYQGLGLWREGAAAALRLGRPGEAAPRLRAAGRPVEAARCWLDAGSRAEALEALFEVSSSDPEYREACVMAAELAEALDDLRFELDHLVGPFLAEPPRNGVEVEAFRRLARLYGRRGRRRSALEMLQGVLEAWPQHSDVLEDIARISAQGWDSGADLRIMAEDAAARGREYGAALDGSQGAGDPLATMELPPLPDLPELPPLPSAAPAPVASAVPRTPSRGGSAVGATPGRVGMTLAPGESLPPSSGSETFDTRDPRPRPPEPEPEDGPAEDGILGPGTLVEGRYLVEALLGRGGMGEVYRAFDQELSERVAVKVLTGRAEGVALARFRQELKLARRLSHRNIVRVHDLGLHGGLRFITMELLEGADLRRHLRAGLDRRIMVDLLRQAAEGLQAAHDLGVVHRDVKPENLFVTLDGVVKVMDFGIARPIGAEGVTVAGSLGGTATYMAPEQARDFSSATAASDQYSLAIVAYEALVGRPPFRHQALYPLLRMHASDPPPPPSHLDASIRPALEAALLQALAKEPVDRFPDCRSFAAALAAGL